MSILDSPHPLLRRLQALALTLPFRIVLAVCILAVHLALLTRIGTTRFGYHFNDEPGAAPVMHDLNVEHWNRLIVSRWDSQHYIALGLRGYSQCRSRAELGPNDVPEGPSCELHFYPTYGFLGAAVVALFHVPIDYALLGISLVSSFAFILMWTGKAMVRGLGVVDCYLSLLLLNVFTTGYALVTVQTDPVLMVLSLFTFVCLERGWLVTGAIVAGAATAVRINGVATGFAYCAWIVAMTVREASRSHRRIEWRWAWRVLLMAISGWGIIGLMGYYAWRFGDPLAYSHAHSRIYHHKVDLGAIFFPDGRLLLQGIWAEPNEGLALAAGLLWFALGHRQALRRFSTEAQAFFYTLYFGVIGISMVGTAGHGYGGCSRYVLMALPVFFAMAAMLRRRPVALVLWLVMSSLHYYDGNMCFYVSQLHPERHKRCNFARYFRSDDLYP